MNMKCNIGFVWFTIFIVKTSDARIKRQIIGGQNADIKDHPYMVSIRKNGLHACGGAIISDKHILSVAHCANRELTPPFTHASVHTGTSTSTGTGQSHKIAKLVVHPQWIGKQSKILANDIAVITLEGRIHFGANQQKVNLPSRMALTGTKAIVTGWGSTDASSTKSATNLQKLEMTIITNAECESHLRAKLTKNHLCAHQTVGHGACLGDSGSPLVYNNEVIGIVSWTLKCANGQPDIYSDVFGFKSFIEGEMR